MNRDTKILNKILATYKKDYAPWSSVTYPRKAKLVDMKTNLQSHEL